MAGWKTQGTDFQKPLLNDAQHVDTTKDLEGNWVTRGWTTRDLLRVGVSAFPLGSPSQGLPMDARWTIGRRGTSKLGPVQQSMAGLQSCSVIDTPEEAQAPVLSGSPDGGAAVLPVLVSPLFPAGATLAARWQLAGHQQIMGKSEIESRFSHLESCISDSDMPPEPLSTRLSCRPRPRLCPWPSSPRSGSRRPPSPSCAAGPCACSFPRRAPP